MYGECEQNDGFPCRQRINQYASLDIPVHISNNFTSGAHCSSLCLLLGCDVMRFLAVQFVLDLKWWNQLLLLVVSRMKSLPAVAYLSKLSEATFVFSKQGARQQKLPGILRSISSSAWICVQLEDMMQFL